jgi:ligand-binding sensor domain-containing protein
LWFGIEGGGLSFFTGNPLSGGEPKFNSLTTKQGLVNNIVMCINSDSSGVLWLGTGNGISRYDGKHFTNYTTAQGLPDYVINTIYKIKVEIAGFAPMEEACAV